MFFNKHSKDTHSLCTMQTSNTFFSVMEHLSSFKVFFEGETEANSIYCFPPYRERVSKNYRIFVPAKK